MASTTPVEPLSTTELRALVGRLGELEPAVDDAERIDRIDVLERLKSACAGAQARETVTLAASQRAEQRSAGVPPDDVGRGIAAQVGLARHESPHRGAGFLRLAETLSADLPRAYAALRRGEVNEWRTMLLVRETACLSPEHRAQVDAELGDRLGTMGDRQIIREARAWAQRLDVASLVRRAQQAESDRTVTIRPAPDTMVYLTALLPVVEGVAAYAALDRAAKSARSAGDPRGRGQILADTFVERVTGRAPADGFDTEIHLVMTDRALLGDSDDPVLVPGHETLPAWLVRRRLGDADDAARTWLRRLYTDPRSGELVAMDSRRRTFDGLIRRMVILRDQTCRTPWCDAPIREIDHVQRHSEGGVTDYRNAAGDCAACNQAREAPGWAVRATSGPGERHEISVTTPTGQHHTSQAPALLPAVELAPPPKPPALSPVERRLSRRVRHHCRQRRARDRGHGRARMLIVQEFECRNPQMWLVSRSHVPSRE